ncbi:hypothetical protein H4R35_001169 [Dimargaris xerosporica]|nr:hypothetical protein H4R35_001169 [Dimargaris xerosporica]
MVCQRAVMSAAESRGHWSSYATVTCSVDPALVQALDKFRFAKQKANVAAFVVKIDRKQLSVVEDEIFDDITLEDLVEELPDDAPRYPLFQAH